MEPSHMPMNIERCDINIGPVINIYSHPRMTCSLRNEVSTPNQELIQNKIFHIWYQTYSIVYLK